MNRKDIRKERIEEGKIIPLYYDFMINNIFNDENYIEVVECFIADYFNYDLQDVKGKIKLRTRELPLYNKKHKSRQVDIVLNYKGDYINIEINTEQLSQGIKSRNCALVCALHGEQLKYGDEDYTNIHKTIQLNFNTKIRNEIDIIECNYITNQYGKMYVDDFRIDALDIAKGTEAWYNGGVNGVTGWCALLSTNDRETFNQILEMMKMPFKLKEKFVKKIHSLSRDDDNFQIYTKLSKRELAENTLRIEAELRGIEKGIEQKTKEAAINFHKNGVSDELIINSLNITKEQLEEYLK